MSHRSPAEKKLIVRLYNYFSAEAKEGNDPLKRGLLQRVADALTIPHVSVSRIVRSWKKNGDDSLDATPPPRGRPPQTINNNVRELITGVIKNRNLSKLPTTSRHIRSELLKMTGRAIPGRTLRREMKRMELSYIHGQARDPRADRECNVTFRLKYLANKRTNLTTRSYPKRPEIYLDESYSNLNHVANKTWLEKSTPRYQVSGAGSRYCIVGAGAILVRNGRLVGEWVPQSVQAWPSHLKNADGDYHGNFTGPLFERWFEQLCESLFKTYGVCRIHLDGAAYHKRILNPAPTKATNKQNIIDWLLDEGATIADSQHLNKDKLLAIVAQMKKPVTYKAVEIAATYGHDVLYTPPYHPELQPIEMVWGAIKNRIALDPATSVGDLGEKVRAGLDAIDKKIWLGAYKKVQRAEEKYLQQVPPPSVETQEAVISEVEFEEYSISL